MTYFKSPDLRINQIRCYSPGQIFVEREEKLGDKKGTPSVIFVNPPHSFSALTMNRCSCGGGPQTEVRVNRWTAAGPFEARRLTSATMNPRLCPFCVSAKSGLTGSRRFVGGRSRGLPEQMVYRCDLWFTTSNVKWPAAHNHYMACLIISCCSQDSLT